jgi:hypothetical protein
VNISEIIKGFVFFAGIDQETGECVKNIRKWSREKCSVTRLTLMGVSPPPLWLPPNAITPEKGKVSYPLNR